MLSQSLDFRLVLATDLHSSSKEAETGPSLGPLNL